MTEGVQFMHFRNYDKDKKPMSHGGFTFAYRNVDDYLEFSLAICSERDNFCRKVGRIISEGRLNVGRSVKATQEEIADSHGELRGYFSLWISHHVA